MITEIDFHTPEGKLFRRQISILYFKRKNRNGAMPTVYNLSQFLQNIGYCCNPIYSIYHRCNIGLSFDSTELLAFKLKYF